MSDTRRDARAFDKLRVGPSDVEGRGGRLDEAIDRAVREMLDVEPPAGLRGRVIDRIASPRRALGWLWVAGTLAAAAILVVAILLPSRGGRPTAAPPLKVANDVHLPPPVVASVPPPRPEVVIAKTGAARPPRAQQRVEAAMVPYTPAFETSVEALPGPAPLGVARLTGPPAPSVTDVGVAPIQIRALEVNALPETPRERREE
jgi:hypothetical protein